MLRRNDKEKGAGRGRQKAKRQTEKEVRGKINETERLRRKENRERK